MRWVLCAALALIFGCDPDLIVDVNTATLRFSLGDDVVDLEHDPLSSTLTLSPPAAGLVALVFINDDPAAELTLEVDSALVEGGDVITLPDDGVVLSASFDTELFEGPAQGNVEVVLLEVDGEAESAALNVDLDVGLTGDSGELAIEGVLDAVIE